MKDFFNWLFAMSTPDIYPVLFMVGVLILAVSSVVILGALTHPVFGIGLVIFLMIAFPVFGYLTK